MPESPAPPATSNPRLVRFFYAVTSGYALLGANVLYTLCSIPLALHFLQRREFGLWALAVQLGGYLQLIDLGMSASVSRHLIDHKDDQQSGAYGGMIKTGGLVLLVQGLLVLLGGFLLTVFGTPFLHIDPDLARLFQIVMILQCAIIAADFPARLFSHILIAHQRADIANYSQITFFIASFATLWFCFARGLGVVSLVWANFAGWLVIVLVNLIACVALGLLPSGKAWGSATWTKFRELFAFGKDVFWIALGTQLIIASQTIVVTRTLGLNSAAVWSVCTRTFALVNQLVWRPFDFSSSMLAEMVARQEKERLLHRFKTLVILTTSLAVLAAAIFALCNGPFVVLWTHGNISWPARNDILLAVWMVLSALVHCHCALPVITKQIGFMRYIFFIEGFAYVVMACLAARQGGFTAIISTSILCTTLFTLPYGIWRTSRYFQLPPGEVAVRWSRPSLWLFLILVPISILVGLACAHLLPAARLALQIGIVTCVGLLLFRYVGLEKELRREISDRAPGPLRRLLTIALVGR